MKKTKRFVIDANTLISAFLLHRNSIPAQAYYKAKREGIIVMSVNTWNEFSDVFVRPKFDKYHPLDKRIAIIDSFKEFVKFIPLTETICVCRDSKDNKYLELAVAAKADCVITGDADLRALHPFRDIPILSASDFLKQF
ncbi:MAG: putative toxin-antitoxin system toxin component, PIN family [Mangrovibacterium sp.]